jgi:hypothetical protein
VFPLNIRFLYGFHLGLATEIWAKLRRVNSTINIDFDLCVVNLLAVCKGNLLLFHDWSDICLVLRDIEVAIVVLRDHLRALVPIYKLRQNTFRLWSLLLHLVWWAVDHFILVDLDRSAHVRRDTLLDGLWRPWQPSMRSIPRVALQVSMHPGVRISFLDPQI